MLYGMLPHPGTMSLRTQLRTRPDETYRRIVEIYAKTGSIDAVARQLGVPVRTFARVVSEHPMLKTMLAAQRENSGDTGSYTSESPAT
jgi:transposase-like protein